MGEIFGVSEGGENRGEGGEDIGCVRGRGEQGRWLGRYLVCQREGTTGVSVGEILGVSEGGENTGDGG